MHIKFATFENSDNHCEFIIPDWALAPLVNGDFSVLTDEEETKLNTFVDKTSKELGNAHFMMDDEETSNLGFRWKNDIDGPVGGDCHRMFVIPSNVSESNNKTTNFYLIKQKKSSKKWYVEKFDNVKDCNDRIDELSVLDGSPYYLPMSKPITNIEKYVSKKFPTDTANEILGQVHSVHKKQLGIIKESLKEGLEDPIKFYNSYMTFINNKIERILMREGELSDSYFKSGVEEEMDRITNKIKTKYDIIEELENIKKNFADLKDGYAGLQSSGKYEKNFGDKIVGNTELKESVIMKTSRPKHDITKSKKSLAAMVEPLIAKMDKLPFQELKIEFTNILTDEEMHASEETRKKWMNTVKNALSKNSLMHAITNLYLKAANMGLHERDSSYTLTKKQYDNVLPIYGNTGTKQLLTKTIHGIDKYYFIGSHEDYLDLLNRCKYINEDT